jgi:hypothetical protein
MWDWIALAIRSNYFLLGLWSYHNSNPIFKGYRPCIYWLLDWNKPQYQVLGLDLSMWYQFYNKLGSDQRWIQSQYPVLGLVSIWSPIDTDTGIGSVTLFLVMWRTCFESVAGSDCHL